jgi:hypothetical protein
MIRSALATCLVACFAVGTADAATVNRDYLMQPASNCQGALPSYETGLRKTPIAIKNVGTAKMFVSCGFQDINNFGANYNSIQPFFINNTGADVTVACTLVNGIFNPSYFAIGYFPKSVVVPPGNIGNLNWEKTTDNGGDAFVAPALSCALPPGVELNVIRHNLTEDVGA